MIVSLFHNYFTGGCVNQSTRMVKPLSLLIHYFTLPIDPTNIPLNTLEEGELCELVKKRVYPCLTRGYWFTDSCEEIVNRCSQGDCLNQLHIGVEK